MTNFEFCLGTGSHGSGKEREEYDICVLKIFNQPQAKEQKVSMKLSDFEELLEYMNSTGVTRIEDWKNRGIK